LPVRLRADDELRMSNDARGPTVPRELCWIVADILADNAARSGAFGANSALRFDFPVACKTGTSTDFRDNWAMGFTPEFTVGVWVGNFDGTPMREVSGVSGAGPILHDVMIDLHRRFGTTWFERPAGIVEREVHPLTGKLLAAPRADSVREKFLETQLPAMESAGDYDAQGRVKLGAEFAEWAASADNQIGTRVAVAGSGGLHLVSPTPGSTFVIDPDVPSSSLVPLVVSGAGDLVWKSPTLSVREVGGKFFAEAVEGEHRLTVLDVASGKTLETWIRVKAL
jgi:penicillin-binding protein 1C